MPPNQKTHTRELTRIEQLLDTYNFKEALQAVESLEHWDDLSPPNRLTCHLLKSQLFNNLGRYEETLKLTETIIRESQRQRKRLHLVDVLIARAEALSFLGRYEEGLDVIKQGEHELVPLARDQPAEIPQRTAALLYHKGMIYLWKGEIDRTWEYGQQSLALREKLGHKKEIADSLVYFGWFYRLKGELDQAMEYGQQSLALAKELGHKLAIGWSLYLIGNIYAAKGELDRALEKHQQSLVLAEELGSKLLIAWLLNIIGYTYLLKGELDQALEYGQQSLVLHEELDLKPAIAVVRNTIGEIYHQRGDLEQAVAHLEQSLALFEKSGVNSFMAWPLFHLISIAIDTASFDRAQLYLQRLQQLNEQEDNKRISMIYRVAEALVLKTSPRARHRVKAEELLEQVAKEEVVHATTVTARLNLCDLLLAELRTSDDPDLLGEVQTHVTRLLEIATQQHSHWLWAETYVLQAKLALVELNVQGARRFLDQAQRLAEERGLQRLAMRISTEHDTLLDQLGQWQDFIDRNASLKERAELARLEEQVVRMIRKRVEKLPELQQ